MKKLLLSLLFIPAISHAAISCMPSTLALSNTPIGKPITRNITRPALLDAPLTTGLAVSWYCEDGTFYEFHTTPAALAAAGSLRVVQYQYISNRTAALTNLAKGNSCYVLNGTECYPLSATKKICVNPVVVGDEKALCTILVKQISTESPWR